MKILLFGDQPSEEEANKRLYREGMLWGLSDQPYKPAIPIAGIPLLAHAVDVYRGAGFDVTIVGDPEEPKKILGNTVRYANPGHSFGDKIRFLSKYGDELLVVSAIDLFPNKKDVDGLCALLEEHKEAALVAPMVHGQSLVDIGFRPNLRTKIYHFRNYEGESERLAFPQLYGIRPERFLLDTMASLANKLYPNREEGCEQKLWPIIKEYFREQHNAETPGFFSTAGNLAYFLAMVWGSKRKFHDRPVTSFYRAGRTLTGLVGRRPPDELKFVSTDFYSLACDVDTEEELAIVRDLVEKGEW